MSDFSFGMTRVINKTASVKDTKGKQKAKQTALTWRKEKRAPNF